MHVAVGRLHLTVALEERAYRVESPRETVDSGVRLERAYLYRQLRQEAEDDRERWRRESFSGGWYR